MTDPFLVDLSLVGRIAIKHYFHINLYLIINYLAALKEEYRFTMKYGKWSNLDEELGGAEWEENSEEKGVQRPWGGRVKKQQKQSQWTEVSKRRDNTQWGGQSWTVVLNATPRNLVSDPSTVRMHWSIFSKEAAYLFRMGGKGSEGKKQVQYLKEESWRWFTPGVGRLWTLGQI